MYMYALDMYMHVSQSIFTGGSKDFYFTHVRPVRKLFENGGVDFASKVAEVLKKADEGGRGEGGTPTLFFSVSNFFLLQFSRHGVGVSSYITNLYNKHARQKKK